ncbi:MAG: hypothetical protein IPJ04_17785 [Candidatus Eisenbacteria bacterium]|nr:hypothetical protein [Candidatus Eisenbacteria bacterium]
MERAPTRASSTGAQTGPIVVNAPNGIFVAWTDRRDTSGVWVDPVSGTGLQLNGGRKRSLGPPDPTRSRRSPVRRTGTLFVWSGSRTDTAFVYASVW